LSFIDALYRDLVMAQIDGQGDQGADGVKGVEVERFQLVVGQVERLQAVKILE